MIKLIYELLKWTVNSSKFIAPIFAFILWIVGLFESLVSSVMDSCALLIDEITGAMDSFGGADLSASNGMQVMSLVNTLFPLTEVLVLLGIYYSTWGLIIIIRWVKSFIPTLAN